MVDEEKYIAEAAASVKDVKPATAAAAAPTPTPAAAKPATPTSSPAPSSTTSSSHDVGHGHVGASSHQTPSPAASWLLRSEGIDGSSIKGSGPHGRLTKGDVLAAITNGTAKKGTASAGHGAAAAAPTGKPATTTSTTGRRSRSHVDTPSSTIRKVIAKRLTESKQTVPHAYSAIDCNMDALNKLRTELKGLSYDTSLLDVALVDDSPFALNVI
jgi:pyruvate/2-oxoglutarate dehydrogenase complex dihydrolipoamide acyltransferase (E2) component